MEDSSKRYEQEAHIQKLQVERERIQQKTFTKWMNSHLKKVHLKVDDMFLDLRDGKILMSLLEVISNVNLGKRNRGTLRVQNVENVNKALKYIQSKVTLENIGAEDIVDGNHRLTLGLIWTIILRFQIQEIVIETESGENKSAKDALLLWCQAKTKNYKNVEIKDFHKSWRDGLGFNALIHAHCPDIIEYDKIVPENHQKNLTQAFNVAEKELGIPNLLDPEDIDVERPDDKSIMTYVSSLYMTFAKMKTENTGAKRVGKIVSNALEISKMIEDYEKLVRNLLQWIQRKIVKLNDRDLPNSLSDMQKEMHEFKQYRTVEKPPKFADRSSIDERLFQIIIKQKENNMKNYVPPEGLLLKEIEVAWDNLEKAEHAREMVLREELLRQERLEQAAEKFSKKAGLRESWLNEIYSVLNNMNVGHTIQSIEAQINKEELIGNEINTTKERFQKLRELAINLEDNKYHNKDFITKRNVDIQGRWKKLQDLLANKQSDSGKLAFLVSTLRTLHTIKLEFDMLKPQINSTEFGKHLMAAEDLLEKHNLVDCQLKSLSDRFNQIKYKSRDFLDSMKSQNLTSDQRQALETLLKDLSEDINNLNVISQRRKDQLAQNCNFHKLISDVEEEELWLSNQIKAMTNNDTGHDFSSVLRLIRRHEVYESEINAHLASFNKLKASALELSHVQSTAKAEIEKRLQELTNGWNKLEKIKSQRRNLLKDAYECQKYYADADDAEQWIAEHFSLVLNKENGEDEGSSQAFIKRHNVLMEKVSTFGDNDMKRLRELVILMTKPQEKHNIRPEKMEKLTKMDSIEIMDKIENNMIQITVEEDTENENNVDIEEESPDNMWYIAISDYAARDSNNNRDMSLVKDEIYKVLKKSSNEWWLVETKDKKKGYAPANYLKENDNVPKMRRSRLKPKSTTLVKKWFPIDSEIAKNYLAKQNRASMHNEIFKGPSARNQDELHYDKVNLEKRQNELDSQYNELVGLTKARFINLQGSTLCHQFFKECGSFMKWMKEKENEFIQRSSIALDVEGTMKKYEAIIDDLAANSGRINYINDLSEQIQKIDPKNEVEITRMNAQTLAKVPFPVDKAKVISTHKSINSQWEKLNKLKCDREKSLAGASSVDLFNKTGEELEESINQKLELLKDDNVGYDKDSNEALKRKFQNLLRDIDAIKHRMERFKYLGDGVRNTYPAEIKYVDDKINHIEGLYNQLQQALNKRNNQLNNASNVHKFINDSKENEQQLNELFRILDNQIIPKDVKTAESCIQQHEPLKYEIKAAESNLDKLKSLANQVLLERPNDTNVISTLEKLDDKLKSLKDKEKKRAQQLADVLEAQKFYKECDQLESIISQQACKFDSIKPQLSVDDVERALKNHGNLAAFVNQIDNRVQKLADRKEQLKSNPDNEKITNRNNKVLEKLDSLHDKCQKKKVDLDNDLEFAKFKENANELNEWIDDKLIAIQDESYKELFNLADKIQKHKALEAEIKANYTSLEKINNWGKDLLLKNHPKKEAIQQILDGLNKTWDKLNFGAEDKDKKLTQACDQSELNENMDDIMRKFEQIEGAMKSGQLGDDLPSAKDLISKHNILEAELANQQDKLLKLKQKAAQMAGDNHFDKGNIEDDIRKLELRCEELNPAFKKRKGDLEIGLKWHQFAFDVDQELQWIEEHRPLANLNDFGRSLADANKLANKHKKLMTEIASHKSVVVKLLEYGTILQQEVGSAYKKDIEIRTKELRDEWNRLERQSEDRKYKLDLSAEGRQLLDDFNDIDLWITEKSYYVHQSDKDLDNDQIENRIMKLKSINVDMATYETLLNNIGRNAKTFKDTCKKSNTLPELVDAVTRKCKDTTDNFNTFKASLIEKQYMLENCQDFKNFQAEITDIENWIDEKLKIADNNDFGEDLQQMQHLKDRWINQLKTIEMGGDRIEACNQRVNELLKSQNSQSDEIISLQEDMQKEWNRLLELSAIKNAKFDAAKEIHTFNKVCKDYADLIDIKNISLPSNCKDRNAINFASMRFETFSKELEQMSAQLKGISKSAETLKQKHPSNAALIDAEIKHLEVLWQNLINHTNKKNDELQYSIDYLNLYEKLKETMAFLNDINVQIKTDRNINTVLAAEEQLIIANECLSNLSKHDPTFKQLVAFSEDIISDDSCENVEEIQRDIDDMLDKKNVTYEALKQWINKSDDVLIQQKFFRDIQQINSSTALQEVKVTVNNFDLDLEETEKHLIKHHNFAHNISVTDDRVENLSKYVNNMREKKHFDINNISALLDDCVKRRQKLHDNYRDIEIKLNDQLRWLMFLRDTDDKNFWIDEKLQQIKTLDKSANNLEEKIHLLQKYKAFEAELSANKPEFEKLQSTTDQMIKENHPKSKEIKDIFHNLNTKWNQLLSESQYRSKVLKEAKDLLVFLDELDAVEAWHREKEFLVSANELGSDLDHCVSLQTKLTEPVGGKQVDETRINEIIRTADDLLQRKTVPALEAENIKSRSKAIKPRWDALKSALSDYKKRLDEAYKMHNYYSELGLLADQVKDRIKLVKVKDLGSDITSVEKLKRKQNAIERDIVVLNEKFQKLQQEDAFGDNLDAEHSIKISLKQKEIKDDLEQLSSLATQKSDLLNLSYRYFKIEKDAKVLIDISSKQSESIDSSSWPVDSKSAKIALKVHDDIKTEMNTRKIKEARIIDLCRKLKEDQEMTRNNIADSTIMVQPSNEQLTTVQNNLLSCVKQTQNSWTQRQNKLNESLQIHLFLETCEIEEQWLVAQEKKCDALIHAVGSSSSVEDVTEYIESKRSISTGISSREKKTLDGTILESLEQLKKNQIRDLKLAEDKYKALSDHFKKLDEKLMKLQNALNSEKEFQELLQRVLDHTTWIRSKLLIASDSNYEDKVNLSNKIKKHKEFLSEIKANEPDILAVLDLGKKLIAEKHMSSVEIEQEISELETQWNNLLSMSDFKMKRLLETNDECLWSRKVDNFVSWLDETENILESHNYGNDLISVERLKRKQMDIEVDINSHNQQLIFIEEEAKKMMDENNYLTKDIKANSEGVRTRFQQLETFLSNHSNNLSDTEILYKFNCDVYYELDWIQDKLQLARKLELGSSLAETDRFIKQHTALMTEITTRSKSIEVIRKQAQDLEIRNHFGKESIRSQRINLENAFEKLCDAKDHRANKLMANKMYQQFSSDAIEIEMRLNDRILLLNNFEKGTDEQSCQNLIKKLHGLDLEIDTETSNTNEMFDRADQLASEYQEKVKEIMKNLQSKLLEIREIINAKRSIIVNNLKYFQYIRETDDVRSWIKNLNSLVIVDEYGKDYDDCIGLMEKFESYNQTLNANKNKINAVKNTGKLLINEKNPFSGQIEKTNTLITDSMHELRENFKIRKEALQGALEVHSFVRESNDLIDWMKNKSIEISSLQQTTTEKPDDIDDTHSDKTEAIVSREFNQPLSVVRKMENNFAKFERDLEAVKSQNERLNVESNRLQTAYPNAKDHIREKNVEIEKVWSALNVAVMQKRNKLKETKQLQMWLLQYKEFLKWTKSQNAKITSVDHLPTDVAGAELLIVITNEQKLEKDTKVLDLNKLLKSGDDIKIAAKFISPIIEEKQNRLQKIWSIMCLNLQTRSEIYEQNLDLRRFFTDVNDLEKWLTINENQLKSVDEKSFKNVPEIEEASKNHEDYIKFVDSEKTKFDAIKRSTKLESTFKKRLEMEQAESDSLWSDDLSANIKRRETQRILQEKRKVNESIQRVHSGGQIEASKPAIIDVKTKKLLKKQASAGELDIQPTIVKPVKFGINIPEIDEEQSKNKGDELAENSTTVKKATSFSTKKRDPIKVSMTPRKYIISGTVWRKQLKVGKGLKAAVRSWKEYFLVLNDNMLIAFKDRNAWLTQPDHPVFTDHIQNAIVEVASNYTKRNFVLHLKLEDLSEMFIQCASASEQFQWQTKLQNSSKFVPGENALQIKPQNITKRPEEIPLTPIDVSAVIDADYLDVSHGRGGSSGFEDDLSSPEPVHHDDFKSKPVVRQKSSPRESKHRPLTEFGSKSKPAERRQLGSNVSPTYNRSNVSEITSNKYQPVPLSIIKNRQSLYLDQKKSSTLPMNEGDQSHKHKSKVNFKKVFSRSSKKRDNDRSDEV